MNDLKEKFKKRAADLKKESRKNRMNNKEKDDFKCQTTSKKICPFMSTPEADRACTSRCKFYRPKQKGYECYFMVLQTISWFLKKMDDEEEKQ